MLDIEAALKVLKSFGYDSSSIPPYIYVDDTNIGICYSFFDSLYGNLDRVALFETKQEMETFLKEFDWYKVSSEKYNISIKLDDYEKKTPKILYLYDEEIIHYDEMQRLDKDDYLSTKQKGVYIKTLNNLIALYENIKNKHEEILTQSLIAECELENLRNSIEQLKNTFKKIKTTKTNQLTPETIIPEADFKGALMQNDLSKISLGSSKKEFEDFLNIVLHNLKTKEIDEGNLNSKFHLQELTLNINALNIQYEEFARILSARKKIFSNKAELYYLFTELEKKDVIQILPTTDLIAKEKQFMETKYNLLKDLPPSQIIPFLNKANGKTSEDLPIIQKELINENKNIEKERRSIYGLN